MWSECSCRWISLRLMTFYAQVGSLSSSETEYPDLRLSELKRAGAKEKTWKKKRCWVSALAAKIILSVRELIVF